MSIGCIANGLNFSDYFCAMNPNRHLMTLDEFTFFQTKQFKNSTGELSTLLRDIGLACKLINKQVNKAGQSKFLQKCELPLTGIACVKKVVTELGVYEISHHGGFKLLERAPGISVDEIKNATAGKLIIEGDIKEMNI